MSGIALALVLCAAVAHAAWNVIAHGTSRSGLAFLWWGSVTGSVIWSVAIPFTGGLGTNDVWGFVAGVSVSAVLHVGYFVLLQRGYQVGDLSTVYATARGTGPLLTVMLAVLLLGEHITGLAAVGVVAIVVGIVAIGVADQGLDVFRTKANAALIFGLLTGVAIAAYTVWDTFALRHWGLSPVAYLVGTSVGEALIVSVTMWRGRLGFPMQLWREQWRKILAFGILSPLSYVLVLTAVTIAPVALVAPIREVSVLLVSLFGVMVMREARPGRRIAASAMVVAGVVLLSL